MRVSLGSVDEDRCVATSCNLCCVYAPDHRAKIAHKSEQPCRRRFLEKHVLGRRSYRAGQIFRMRAAKSQLESLAHFQSEEGERFGAQLQSIDLDRVLDWYEYRSVAPLRWWLGDLSQFEVRGLWPVRLRHYFGQLLTLNGTSVASVCGGGPGGGHGF